MSNVAASSPLRHSISFSSNASNSPPTTRRDFVPKSPIPSKDSILSESSKGWAPLRTPIKRTPLSPSGMSRDGSEGMTRSRSSENSLSQLAESHPTTNARKSSSSFKTLDRDLVKNSPFIKNGPAPVSSNLPSPRVSRVPGRIPQSPVGLGLDKSNFAKATSNASTTKQRITPSSSESELSDAANSDIKPPKRRSYGTGALGGQNLVSGSPFTSQIPTPGGRSPTRTAFNVRQHNTPNGSFTEELALVSEQLEPEEIDEGNNTSYASFTSTRSQSPTKNNDILPLELTRQSSGSSEITRNANASPIVSKLVSPRRMTGPRTLGSSVSSMSDITGPSSAMLAGHSRSKSGSGESTISMEPTDALGIGRPRSKTVTFAESEEVREFESDEQRRISGSSVASTESGASTQSGVSDGSDMTLDAYTSQYERSDGGWLPSATSFDPAIAQYTASARELPPIPTQQSSHDAFGPVEYVDNSETSQFSGNDKGEMEDTPTLGPIYTADQHNYDFGQLTLSLPSLPSIATSSPLMNFDSEMGNFLHESPQLPQVRSSTPPAAQPQRRPFREVFAERLQQKGKTPAIDTGVVKPQISADMDVDEVEIIATEPVPILSAARNFDSMKSPLERLGASAVLSPDSSLSCDTPDMSIVIPDTPVETLRASAVLPGEKDKLADHRASLLEARKRARAAVEEDPRRPARRRRSVSTSEVERSPLPARMSQIVESDARVLNRPTSVDGLPRMQPLSAQPSSEEPFKTYRAIERRVEIASVAGVGDVSISKASGRKVRNVSDMNHHFEDLKKFRESNLDLTAIGVVFLKPRSISLNPHIMPLRETWMKLRLHNGSETVSSERWKPVVAETQDPSDEWALDKSASSLSVKLDLIVRVDPSKDFHLIGETVHDDPNAPPALTRKTSGGGFRKFFGGSNSPKKTNRAMSQIVQPKDAFADYLNRDHVFATTPIISFERLEGLCTGKVHTAELDLFDTANGSRRLGRIKADFLYIPPLPGVPTESFPASSRQAIDGLAKMKMSHEQRHRGQLSQMGGDCRAWKLRDFRLSGSQLVASSLITHKDTYLIDLSNASGLEDCNDGISNAIAATSPVAATMDWQSSRATTIRSSVDLDERFDVERSFRIHFKDESYISFYTNTDQAKADWMKALDQAITNSIASEMPLWAAAFKSLLRKQKVEERRIAANDKAVSVDKAVPAIPVVAAPKPTRQPPPQRTTSLQSLSEDEESDMSANYSAPNNQRKLAQSCSIDELATQAMASPQKRRP